MVPAALANLNDDRHRVPPDRLREYTLFISGRSGRDNEKPCICKPVFYMILIVGFFIYLPK